MDQSTIDYYNRNAREYAEKTRYVYFHDTRTVFFENVAPGARLLDAGCGGGRDLKIFGELGYTADAFDASPELCRIASEYTENEVECCTFEDWQPQYTYGGIWACASLLHLTEDEFFAFFRKAKNCLASGGVIYFSMKTDIEDGYDENGRYYLNFNNQRLNRILRENPELARLKYWKTFDNLKRDIVWANVILRKVG